MELSKLSEGFIVADALVIKAQVQVIRYRNFQLHFSKVTRRQLHFFLDLSIQGKITPAISLP